MTGRKGSRWDLSLELLSALEGGPVLIRMEQDWRSFDDYRDINGQLNRNPWADFDSS